MQSLEEYKQHSWFRNKFLCVHILLYAWNHKPDISYKTYSLILKQVLDLETCLNFWGKTSEISLLKISEDKFRKLSHAWVPSEYHPCLCVSHVAKKSTSLHYTALALEWMFLCKKNKCIRQHKWWMSRHSHKNYLIDISLGSNLYVLSG